MPKTVQIRDIEDEAYAALKRQAAFEGMSVPEYLRRHVERLAARPSMKEWLAEIAAHPINSKISREQVIEALDEMRGPWPDAGS